MPGEFNEIPPIPRETARTAKAIFGGRNFYIQVGEGLEAILSNNTVNRASGAGIVNTILPVITCFQALEGLTDVQAIDAVRTRIDWKFALHLGIHPPSVQQNALCELRRRIMIDPVLQREFQRLIDWLIMLNPPLDDKFQDFQNLELLAFVCSVNRLSRAHEAMQQTLEALACKYPDWLLKTAMPHWYGRYRGMTSRFDSSAPLHTQALALREIGADIHHLLNEVRRSGRPELRELQELKALDHVWKKQFETRNLRLNDCDFCIHKEPRKETSYTRKQTMS